MHDSYLFFHDLQNESRDGRDDANEQVGSGQGDEGETRRLKEEAERVHQRDRRPAVQDHEDEEPRERVPADVGLLVKDEEDEDAEHGRDEVGWEVPGVRRDPVEPRREPRDELEVLAARDTVLDEVDDEGGGDEAHGVDYADGVEQREGWTLPGQLKW